MNRPLSVLAVVLLALCIGSAASAAGFGDDILAGMNLGAEEVEALEERLGSNPHDLQARGQLIVYYHAKSFRDAGSRRIHADHVLWMIRNAPDADFLAAPHAKVDPVMNPEGYFAGKFAWNDHLEQEPTDATVVGNAANFFSEFQDREAVIETLQKAKSLDPHNPKWPTLLGHVYLRVASFSRQLDAIAPLPEGLDADSPHLPDGLAGLFEQPRPEGSSTATLALEEFERAYELTGDLERPHLRGSLAKAAFDAERYDDARAYATTMLDDATSGWDQGNQLHHGNLILGRIALLQDDVAQAKYHLLEAGGVSGSPQLNSFGPNMRLAADLLELGERDVVLAYFELCANFWPRDELKDWAALVEAGQTPDFGANLVY
ncbi:MAG: RNA polymerase subunit sigma-24 [Gammaproteobacteria bacterium]|nr:RNA polymerase subunit sigma-24 [Gammaproteobacteria bacterium]